MSWGLKWKKQIGEWSQGESVTVNYWSMTWTGTVKAVRNKAAWEYIDGLTLLIDPTKGGMARQMSAQFVTHGIQQPAVRGCQHCGAPLTGRSHAKTCSPKCRKALSRLTKV